MFEGRVNSDYKGQWVQAQNLKVDDKVLLCDNSYGIIDLVEVKQLKDTETTYNLEVADYHTYYVGEQGVCVHNACIDDIYKSVNDHPNFDADFIPTHKTTFKNITNFDLADDLMKIDPGKWAKAYQNGFIDGQKYSMHYFKNLTNKNIFGLKYVTGWVT